MKKQMDIIVAGEKLGLRKMEKAELRGVYADALVSFEFYLANFQDHSFILLAHKNGRRYTPAQYSNTARRLASILNRPVAFLFDNLVNYERDRMIKQGAYFIVSDKYAFLPFMIINARTAEGSTKNSLSAVAQYLLLYHLQIKSIEGLTFKKLEDIVPFKYITLTRAVKLLGQFNLCETTRNQDNALTVHFSSEGKELWRNALPFMRSPIKKTFYCDALNGVENMYICSYNALSHYSSLNPDEKRMYAIDASMFRDMEKDGRFVGINDMDGDVMVEIWDYPPVTTDNVADKLSLYLTLREDNDPRVENELEMMIENLW